METTLTLRKRLGFNEITEWKQFCARRLHLIHTLSLNLRKASEQDEQVRVLAAELCAEYGYNSNAQGDFEKLLIAGIQSVRRNQKRSSRNPNGSQYQNHLLRERGSSDYNYIHNMEDQNGKFVYTSPSRSGSSPRLCIPTTTASQFNPANSHQNVPYSPSASNAPFYKMVSRGSGIQGESINGSQGPPDGPHGHAKVVHTTSTDTSDQFEAPMTQSLILRLEVLRGMIKAASATWIEVSAPIIAHMCAKGVLSAAIAASVVHSKLSKAQFEEICESITQGPLLEALRLALDPHRTQVRLLERIGALAASLVHGPNLLSALQALFVCLIQTSRGSIENMRYILKPMALKEAEQMNFNPTEPYQSDASQYTAHSISTLAPPCLESMNQLTPRSSLTPHQPTPFFQPPIMITQPPLPMHMVSQGMYIQQQSGPIQAPFPTINDSKNTPPASNGESSTQISEITPKTPSSSVPSMPEGSNDINVTTPNPDRLVIIQFDNRVLEMTYSPLKATPPTISEIIDNARQSFSIPASAVIRIKYVQRNKIIETDSELIDALTQRQVNLELLIPPPMLMGVHRGDGKAKFTPLAPIFRSS